MGYWDMLILSIPKICISLIILSLFILLARFIGRMLQRRISGRSSDGITSRFLVRLVKAALLVVGIILAFHALGFTGIAGGLMAGAGVGAVAIGFAFKAIGENFLAGIILVFDRPFNIGDTVTIDGNMGKIENLLFRSTHMKTFDGKDVFVPNATIITSNLYNHTRDGNLRQEFIIGIDYEDDIGDAIKLIIKAVQRHPKLMEDERTQVVVDEFAASTVNLRVLFWVLTKDYKRTAAGMRGEVMKLVKETLMAEGFGLPSNIQELKLYRDRPLPLAPISDNIKRDSDSANAN